MRRCIALFLLALLPLQFSWAAVSGYCGHERGAPAQHLGHHVHEHAGGAVAADEGGTTALGAFDTADQDCSQCHGCCAGMPLPVPAMHVDLAALQPAMPVPRTTFSLVQAPPERPQWPPVA